MYFQDFMHYLSELDFNVCASNLCWLHYQNCAECSN